MAYGTGETYAVDGGEGVDHGAYGAEATRDEGLCFGQGGDDDFCKVEEEGFSLLGAFTFVVKCQFFVCPAGKLHKIEMVRLERCAELTGFLGVEATFLELHAVDLDAEDEVLGNTRPDALSDFYDEARAVG